MIISASYRTDIPTFYGQWFMNRLHTGHCKVHNPYSSATFTVSLKREDVDGFVFWTKNLGPFLPHLPEVRDRGFPFIIQYTIDNYPRQLEQAVIDSRRSIDHVHQVAGQFGQQACVWRYDPIILSSLTPLDFHLSNFAQIAAQLRGAVDEVVVSFANIYRKTRRNTQAAAQQHNFTWEDPTDETKRKLLADLLPIAQSAGMKLAICAQRQYLIPGLADARCIDADRLARISGIPLKSPAKPHREDCGCYQSRDIGEYDTCPHGCVYCYAVQNRAKAQDRHRHHDPGGEFLYER